MQAQLPEVRTISAPRAGPIVAILGGVHGDEYEGVIAANALAKRLTSDLVAGAVRVASPAHPAAWNSCTRESPSDGKNLARVFPGDHQGSPTQKLAHIITEQVIRGSDLLIDLHSAGSNFEMPFLCGFNGGSDQTAAHSQRLAGVFCAQFTWLHEPSPGLGRSLTTAYDLEIPAIYVEGHGGRSIRRADFQGYLDGVRRVLHDLKMVTDAPPATYTTINVQGDGNTDEGMAAPIDGYMVTRVGSGEYVTEECIIADIVDIDGAVLTTVRAERAGYIMLLRRDAHVTAGVTICIVATSHPKT